MTRSRYKAALTHAIASYKQQFFNKTTNDYGPTQTGNALGILIAPEPGAVERLVDSIKSHGTHLTSGAVGTRWILQALTAANRTDVALDLATQKSAPSWYNFVTLGPGTLHEQWPTGAVPDGTKGPSMNHPMFGGGVDPWIYHHVGGLRPPSSLSASFTVATTTTGPLPLVEFGVEAMVMQRVQAAAVQTTLLGGCVVRSAWRYDETARQLRYNLSVPIGFSGRLHVPTSVSGAGLGMVDESGGLTKQRVVWAATNDAARSGIDHNKNIGEDAAAAAVDGILGASVEAVGVGGMVVAVSLGSGDFAFSASYSL
eukprot:COSAG01_NODE_10260_length_2208_cov_0.909436_1_plen_313_part_00